jgi:single-strand DNA-binding protein
MASFNKVILMGNLTRDPELRYTPNGLAVTNLGMAINSRIKQGEDWKDDVCFVDVVVFGKQAENCSEYLAKGRLALIEGRLQWRSWEDQSGQKRNKHEVVAQTVRFMPKGTAGGGETFSKEESPFPGDEEELPF